MYPKAREPGANLCGQRRKTDWRSGRRGRAGANVNCLPGRPAKQGLEQLFGRISETKAAIMACFRTSGNPISANSAAKKQWKYGFPLEKDGVSYVGANRVPKRRVLIA